MQPGASFVPTFKVDFDSSAFKDKQHPGSHLGEDTSLSQGHTERPTAIRNSRSLTPADNLDNVHVLTVAGSLSTWRETTLT